MPSGNVACASRVAHCSGQVHCSSCRCRSTVATCRSCRSCRSPLASSPSPHAHSVRAHAHTHHANALQIAAFVHVIATSVHALPLALMPSMLLAAPNHLLGSPQFSLARTLVPCRNSLHNSLCCANALLAHVLLHRPLAAHADFAAPLLHVVTLLAVVRYRSHPLTFSRLAGSIERCRSAHEPHGAAVLPPRAASLSQRASRAGP